MIAWGSVVLIAVAAAVAVLSSAVEDRARQPPSGNPEETITMCESDPVSLTLEFTRPSYSMDEPAYAWINATNVADTAHNISTDLAFVEIYRIQASGEHELVHSRHRNQDPGSSITVPPRSSVPVYPNPMLMWGPSGLGEGAGQYLYVLRMPPNGGPCGQEPFVVTQDR